MTTPRSATPRNSAERLAALVRRVNAIPRKPALVPLDGWRMAFATPASAKMTDYDVVACLATVRDEVEHMRGLLEAMDWDPETYEHVVNTMLETFSVTSILTTFDSSQTRLNESLLGNLRLIGQSLLPDYGVVSDSDVEAMGVLVENWRLEVKEADLPLALKRLLNHQIDLLFRSILESRIRGSIAIDRAAAVSAVTWISTEAMWKPYQHHKVVKEVLGGMAKAREVCRDMILFGGATMALLLPVEKSVSIVKEVRALMSAPPATAPSTEQKEPGTAPAQPPPPGPEGSDIG